MHLREHALELDGPPVSLGVGATYTDAATFVPPPEGRAILLGAHRGLVGPGGTRAQGYGTRVVFDDGKLVAPVAPDAAGTWTVVGDGADVRLVTPPTLDSEVDGSPVALGPVGGWEVGEYVVEFSVARHTWLTSRLIGWTTPQVDGTVVVEPLDGQADPTRSGGPWHLEPGPYAARVTAGEPGDHGFFELHSVTPVEVDGAGEVVLTADDVAPGLALYDLTGEHAIAVVGTAASAPGWTLTWSADAPPATCSTVLGCLATGAPTLPHLARLDPRISGRGYLALTSTDGGSHTVTVRIGH